MIYEKRHLFGKTTHCRRRISFPAMGHIKNTFCPPYHENWTLNNAHYAGTCFDTPLACSHLKHCRFKARTEQKLSGSSSYANVKSQKTASDASWSRSVMNRSHIAAFQCLICGIRTYVELGNTEVGLHRAQLPGFIFKKHPQLLQASSARVQREMTRGWACVK